MRILITAIYVTVYSRTKLAEVKKDRSRWRKYRFEEEDDDEEKEASWSFVFCYTTQAAMVVKMFSTDPSPGP